MIRKLFVTMLLSLLTLLLFPQEKIFTPGGFVRGGLFLSTGDYSNDVNAAFGDAALTLTATDNHSFKAYGDVRMRMGQQFGKNEDSFILREAWGMLYNSYMSISLGKKIIKWGKTDIFSPLSRFNPIDYTLRSPDFEDKEIGNLAGELVITPSPSLRLSAVATPFWYPSVLITTPLELPENISLLMPAGLSTGNGYFSYGFRGDLLLRGLDAGLQWYHGPDLLPGLSLTLADFTNPLNPLMAITGVPYIINQAGIDFETVLTPFVLRGTLAYSHPVDEKEGKEEIPFPQVEWVAGMDWTPGAIRMTLEYSGKKVLDFYPSPYDPIIGTDPDLAQLAELFNTPGFDPVEFTRMQTEAFGRLYNNQISEYYHSAGLKIEADLMYGRMTPSVMAIYNFTSRDLLIMPAIEFKPSDGVTLSTGIEHYSGKKGGLYDIIDDFMNAAFIALKIEF
ncbi:MAG: hypothetical protein RBT02_06250 [Bacteroidales bacterium]|jgi:hypothetical protein|nr:hypothetical protein [Bacteroidales bacterium]